MPPSPSAQAFATCLPVAMPTEKGNKGLTAGTPPTRLERGHPTSLRHTHVWARLGWRPVRMAFVKCAWHLFRGPGRGQYPIHRSGMRAGPVHSVGTVPGRSSGRKSGSRCQRSVQCLSPSVGQSVGRSFGWLVGWFAPQVSPNHGKREAGDSEERSRV